MIISANMTFVRRLILYMIGYERFWSDLSDITQCLRNLHCASSKVLSKSERFFKKFN